MRYLEIIPTNIKEETEFDEALREFANEQITKVEEEMDSYHISNAISEVWKYIARVNKYIDETAPWVLAKDENLKERLNSVMFNLAEALRKISIMASPFIPNSSKEILKQLSINEEDSNWNNLRDNNIIRPDTKIVEKGEPLFIRLDKEEEIEYIKSQMKGK